MEELLNELAKVYGSFDDRHNSSLNAFGAECDPKVLKVQNF